MGTEDIENHMAFVCGCGGVEFNLLKSGKIECPECEKVFGGWRAIEDGLYYCENCRVLKTISTDINCNACGGDNFIKTKTANTGTCSNGFYL